MTPLRRFAWCLVLATVAVPVHLASADEGKQGAKEQAPAQKQGHSALGNLVDRWNYILCPDILSKLDLKKEQCDQLCKLNYEFRAKRREFLAKMAGEMSNAFQTSVKEEDQAEEESCVCQLGVSFAASVAGLRAMRDSYELKALDLLTADQRSQYHKLHREQVLAQRQERQDRQHENQAKVRLENHRVRASHFMDQLNLTDAQKEKAMQLHKEFEGKFENLLTDEQKQKLGQFKQQQQRFQIRQEGRFQKRAEPNKSKAPQPKPEANKPISDDNDEASR